MNALLELLRTERKQVFCCLAFLIAVGLWMANNAHKSDLLTEAFLQCTGGNHNTYIAFPEEVKHCIRTHPLIHKGDSWMSPTDTDENTRYAPVEATVLSVSDDELVIDAGVDREVTVPLRLVRNAEEAKSLEKDEFAVIDITEDFAIAQGLV